AREVVERVHEPLYHVGLRLAPALGALPGHALLVIVELGGEPEVAILQLGKSLAGGLDNSRALRHVDRLLGCVGLVMLLGHGFSGPKQPAWSQCLRPSETEVSQQDTK